MKRTLKRELKEYLKLLKGKRIEAVSMLQRISGPVIGVGAVLRRGSGSVCISRETAAGEVGCRLRQLLYPGRACRG